MIYSMDYTVLPIYDVIKILYCTFWVIGNLTTINVRSSQRKIAKWYLEINKAHALLDCGII